MGVIEICIKIRLDGPKSNACISANCEGAHSNLVLVVTELIGMAPFKMSLLLFQEVPLLFLALLKLRLQTGQHSCLQFHLPLQGIFLLFQNLDYGIGKKKQLLSILDVSYRKF